MQAFIEQERDDFETDDGGRSFHRTLLAVRVWHAAETPMEEDLLTFLLADPAVAGLLGERLAWGARPQDELMPCAVLHRITGVRDYHMRGPSGLVESLIQIDLWAGAWLAAKQAARVVAAAIAPLASGPAH